MGLMDKVRAQATVLAQKTQETAREGMARLDQATANRQAETMLRNLGALVYAEQTGRAAPDSAEQVARLVGKLSAHEAENGINLAAEPGGWTPAGPGRDAAGPGQDVGVPEQRGPGQPGPAPFAEPGTPGEQPSGEPGPRDPGAPGEQPVGEPGPSGSGKGFTQPGNTFPPPPSGDDPTAYPPEPGATPNS